MLIVEKLLRKFLNNITSYKESKVEIFSMLGFFSLLKFQHGGNNLVLMNKVVIVFTMETMHK
jgi:hypothetical protein